MLIIYTLGTFMIQVELYYDDSMIQTKCIDVIMNNSENLSYNIFSQAYNIRSHL